jgi:hypothetical protein
MKLLLSILVTGIAVLLATAFTAPPMNLAAAAGEVRAVRLPTVLKEASGLAASPDQAVFWTHNDSGSEAVLYAIDPTSGVIRGQKTLPRTHAVDWEDIGIGPYRQADGKLNLAPHLYIADTGDNKYRRDDACIYVTREPAVTRG